MPRPPVRADLTELRRRKSLLRDDARPEKLARRHDAGRLTARECLDRLVEPGTFVEYAGHVIAAQRGRRSLDELLVATAGDGVIAGLADVNAHGVERPGAAVLSYDYLVLAGTQGMAGHLKTDRVLDVIERTRRPVVFFAEGGGGRPGDTDAAKVAGLDLMTFRSFARLSGRVPRVGVAAGYCFAGNAALFGMCDITIATIGSSIGMGGPAMIEGGGLGVVAPQDVGPLDIHVASGVVDVVADGDEQAVSLAAQALSYFQGRTDTWTAPDSDALREVVPENRRRAYDVRAALRGIVDEGSILELRPRFAKGMVTALARIEGRPLGVVANNPMHLAGAITSDAADTAAQLLRLCDAYGLPVLSLCDTPGIMVGTEAEKTGLVRRAAGLFTAGASLTVPLVTIVLRKGYGLGAMAMAGGSFHVPLATVSWPTGEFGGMNLEGAVRLGQKRELDAIADPAEREAAYEKAVARSYEHGKALSTATYGEIDDVIDPADTRRLVAATLWAGPPIEGSGRPY